LLQDPNNPGQYIAVVESKFLVPRIKQCLSKDIIFLLMSAIVVGEGFGHANGVLVNNRLKTVTRIEPNGAAAELDETDPINLLMKVGMKYICGHRFPNYTCVNLEDAYCPRNFGVQYKQAPARHGGGYCVAWTAYMLLTQMLNPDYTVLELSDAVTDIYNGLQLKTLIRRFIDFMDDYIKKYRKDLWIKHLERGLERGLESKEFFSPTL
jgi:hypothetical protein